MATILELAEFSRAAYGDPAPNGWTALEPCAPNEHEYFGQAYLNNVTGEIVITNRGTRLTSLQDLISNFQLSLGIATGAQEDAAEYARTIADDYPGHPIIETGHSLGGNEAQAATVALTTKGGVTVSAVTFNSPGIGGYPVGNAAYNVLNLYDQGDVIHLAGGTHLGKSAEISAGPDPAKLTFGIPLLAAGLVGAVTFLGKVIWDILGTAHSIDTMVSYLASDPLGQENWPGTSSIALPGDQSNHWATVNPDGSVILTDAAGDTFQYSTDAGGGQVSTWSTFDGSSGSQTLNFDVSSNAVNETITAVSAAGVKTEDIKGFDTDGTVRDETITVTRADGTLASRSSRNSSGDAVTQNFDTDGKLVSGDWGKADGSYGYSNTSQLGYYYSVANNVNGSISFTSNSIGSNTNHNPEYGNYTSTINANGSGSGTSYYADGSLASEWVINADGVGNGSSHYADGSLASEWAINADGSMTMSSYAPDGSRSNNIINADGSGNGTDYYSDGSLAYVWTGNADGLRNITHYGSNGSEQHFTQNTYYTSDNGSYRRNLSSPMGGGVFLAVNNLDGSSDSSFSFSSGSSMNRQHLPNGTTRIYISNIDGSGSIATTGISAQFLDPGQLSTGGSFNAPAITQSGTSTSNPDGSVSSQEVFYGSGMRGIITNNLDGSKKETAYFNGFVFSSNVTNADGSVNKTYHNWDGSVYSASNTNVDGSGISIFGTSYETSITERNADGSSIQKFYYASGAYSIFTINADGSATGKSYDANGIIYFSNFSTVNADGSSTNTWQNSDGSHGTLTTYPDGASSGSSVTYNPDGSYDEYINGANGSHSTIYHNADGTISSSDVVTINADGSSTHTWSYSDGNHSTSTTYSDGSSSGLNYKADGSYISFINDGLGSVTTNFFGASGNALGLSVSINDAQGNPVSTIYDVNGIVLGVATGCMAQQVLPAGASAIQFVSSISSADLAVSQNSQGNFLISFNNGTGTLDIPAQPAVTSSVEASFVNGTSWQFVNAAGNSYNFTAGSGVTYLINPSSVQFGAGINSSMITLGLGSLMLRVGNSGDLLHIEGINPADALNSGVLQSFTFADGTTLSYSDLLARGFDIYGTTGNEILTGTNLNDRIYGDDGNDTLQGGVGNDTYLFNLGGGQDTINDGDSTVGNLDTIRFGAGVAASDITFTRSGNDLVLGINGTADQLKIQNWGSGDAYRIERVEFADGTVWDTAYLQEHIPIVGTTGNDTLYGDAGNNTFDGGAGNDYLIGGAGNDTYLFNLGDGQDTISEGDSAVVNLDRIRFGAGIVASEITIARSGMDLVLGINGTSDQLTIQGWGYGNDYRIEQVEFADGTAWDTAYLQTLIPAPTLVGTNADDVLSLWAGDVGTLQGLDGNDSILAIDGNNTLDGGVGNDYLMGGLGDDVYVFNPGDGQDEIDDWSDIAGSVDTVRFGVGILPDDIVFSFNGGNLVLGINGTTDQLTIWVWAYDTYSRIERVEFADGTVWDAAYLQDRAVMPIMGTSSDDQLDASNYLGANGYLLNQNVSIQGLEGNDSLYGGDGNDRLDGGAGDDSLAGGAGNDTLIGGEGNDTYAFNLGDGTDTISDAAISLAGAEVNTLVLGAGITVAMITPVISAAGEVTLDFGNGDSIRINQVGNLSIQNIQLADGNVIAIESLLNAPPVAVADSVIVSEDTAQATIVAADLLANDTDPDTGDTLSLDGFDAVTAQGNTVTQDANGNLVFDIGNRYQYLAQGQTATDTFNYSITDTAGATSTAQVNMTIAGLNDAPVAAADAAYVREDLNITATGNVLSNDNDADQGTVLSVADAGVRAGSYGSLNLAADGSYSYALDNTSLAVQSLGRDAQVAEHFGYTATDGMVGVSAVLDVFLSGANDAPILVAPLADQNFTSDKHFSWQMPEGSFIDIDQGDTLGYTATLADGSALPDWLSFDAATRTFSGETPKEVGFVDVQVTATDSVAATGSTAGSLSTSDVFRISVSHGNEGVGNGEDAPPPGHDHNTNDGAGTSPGHPGSKGGNGHPTASASHPQEQEPHDRSSDAKTHKDDTRQQDSEDTEDSGNHRTDELIRTWFEEESASEQYSSFGALDRHGAWGGQIDRQVNRNVARGISEDVSSEWERMNARLKEHLEQSSGDEGIFAEPGTGSRSFGLFGSGGSQGIPQLGMGNGQQLKALAGLKEGLERLGC